MMQAALEKKMPAYFVSQEGSGVEIVDEKLRAA